MVAAANLGKAKKLSDVSNHIDKWETKVLVLSRDFSKKISEKMKAAVLQLTEEISQVETHEVALYPGRKTPRAPNFNVDRRSVFAHATRPFEPRKFRKLIANELPQH